MDPLILSMLLYLKSLGIETVSPQVDRPSYVVITEDEMQARFGKKPGGLCLNGQIYLNSKIDLNTCVGKSVLLHELVHYTQNYCPLAPSFMDYQYREKSAYSVQNRYLKDNNCGNFQTIPGSEGTVEFYERPREDDKGYNGKSLPEPREEAADSIRRRFKDVEGRQDKFTKRGFHSRFEDKVLDAETIKEYNSRTR